MSKPWNDTKMVVFTDEQRAEIDAEVAKMVDNIKNEICSCHENQDVDGLDCPKDNDEGIEYCHVVGHLNGLLTCRACGWKDHW